MEYTARRWLPLALLLAESEGVLAYVPLAALVASRGESDRKPRTDDFSFSEMGLGHKVLWTPSEWPLVALKLGLQVPMSVVVVQEVGGLTLTCDDLLWTGAPAHSLLSQ